MLISKIDSLNLLSKISPGKLLNATKVLGSYYYSRLTGNAFHSGFPFSLGIEPTTSCNLRCPECPSGLRSFTRPTGNLSEKTFKTIIDQMEDYLIYLTFYFQGEPYLHPEFTRLVRYAADKSIFTTTSTNAHYLNDENSRKTVESGLNRIIISIDGTDQETFASYRVGGNLERVIEGTRNLVEWRAKLGSKTPQILFQFLVVRQNEHQVEEIKKLGKEIKVDKVVFKTAQIYKFENGSPLIPKASKYARYKQDADGSWSIKNPLDNHCWKMWHSCVMTWDGRIVPCCFDKDASHQMGNIMDSDFLSIWNGENYRAFRQSLLHSRKNIDICKNCSEGTRVWA